MIQLEWFETNLQVFTLELKKQLKSCQEVIQNPTPNKVQSIAAKDAQLNNLKRMVENRCFSELAKNVFEEKQFIYLMQGIHAIAGSLEKLGDYCVSIANQTLYLADKEYFSKNYNYPLFFEIIENGLDKIQEALFSQNIETGVLICKSEILLDYIYESKLKEIIEGLQKNKTDTENLITSLFIFHYFERMGDTLLNIGESIVSAAMGENLKIDQVNRLKDSLGFDFHEELKVNDVKFRSIWGTRSGCRIGEVIGPLGDVDSIYKDGDAAKLNKEKLSIENWNKKFPNIAPKVLNFEQTDKNATILLQRIYGQTIKETIINADSVMLNEILCALEERLTNIWNTTKEKKVTSTNYMAQLYNRLPDIYFAHSELKTKSSRFGDIKSISFDKSIEKLQVIEESIKAPIQVLGHGDFNNDNIIYNPETKEIHYIDLHRSEMNDYIQDISVYLISCFRLPVFRTEVRELINEAITRQFNLAKKFAQDNGDTTFHLRMALGLVRSLSTSTRFELNKEFAKEMFMRSNYLINHILEKSASPTEFTFPLEILHYE